MDNYTISLGNTPAEQAVAMLHKVATYIAEFGGNDGQDHEITYEPAMGAYPAQWVWTASDSGGTFTERLLFAGGVWHSSEDTAPTPWVNWG